ncbi:UAP56-interacting factor [Amia ocellicauda]|uniref:UAP56-interacting factor n=1 Tax=Amia ocellicauda TaxID=2972642 RepID=UPI003463BA0F
MGDSIADPAPMEVEGSSEKIDMSLDDIIKLNRKEQKFTQEKTFKDKKKEIANRNRLAGKINRQQWAPFRRGAYYLQSAPYRLRFMGQDLHEFNRRMPYNLRKTTLATKGVSPLNRKAWSAKGKQVGGVVPTNRLGEQFRQLKTQPQFRKKFWQPFRGPSTTSRRTSQENRGQSLEQIQHQQMQGRQSQISINRRFNTRRNNGNIVEKYQKTRSWRQIPSPGSILTVSVPNSKAAPETGFRVKRPALPEGSTEGVHVSPPKPKGIPLRYNFKAIANQTRVTLDERFTCLKIRGSSGGARRGRRTVMLQ